MKLERVIETFLQEKDRRILNDLKPEEKQIVLEILKEYRDNGYSGILKECWDLDYESRPPTYQEFIDDEYYLGGTVGKNLYRIWREELPKALAPDSKVITIVFTGPIGIGKTYVGLSALLYKITLLAHMKDPQAFYGIDSATPIVFGVYAPTLGQSDLASWSTCIGFMQESPFFKEVMHVDPLKEYKNGSVAFPKRLRLIAGSRKIHALGGNLFGHLMDETEFRIEANSSQAAHDIHTSLMRRMESRFMQEGGIIPGISILASSANSQSGFLSNFIKDHRNDPTVVIYDYPIWEVKKDNMRYSGKTFKVDAGDTTHNPKILTSIDSTFEEITDVLANVRSNARIIDVPEEYYKQFKDNLSDSIRDIAGVAIASTRRLFSNPDVVLRNVVKDRVNPFTKDVIEMTTATKEHIHDFFDLEKTFIVRKGIAQPRFHPECLRFLHLDLSRKRDKTGLAIVHLWRGGSEVIIDDPEMNIPLKLNSGRLYVDALVGLQSDGKYEIDYSKIRTFILWLRKSGMHISKVTMDDYQSTDMINILHKHSIDAERFSLDRSKVPYLTVRNAFIEDRVDMLDHELCIAELLHLNEEEKKIDHEEKSGTYNPEGPCSKDIADALTGACFTALTSTRHQIDLPYDTSTEEKKSEKPDTIQVIGMGYSSKFVTEGYDATIDRNYVVLNNDTIPEKFF